MIDASGWPAGTWAYYRMFPHEPSAARALDIHIDQIVPIQQITLEKVLDEILALDEADGDEILIAPTVTEEEGNPGWPVDAARLEGCGRRCDAGEVQAISEANGTVGRRPESADGWTASSKTLWIGCKSSGFGYARAGARTLPEMAAGEGAEPRA